MQRCAQSKNSVMQCNASAVTALCKRLQANRNEFYFFPFAARTTANQRSRQQWRNSNYFVMACARTWRSIDLRCVSLQSFLAATENACVALRKFFTQCLINYAVFNKLRYVALRYLLLEIAHFNTLFNYSACIFPSNLADFNTFYDRICSTKYNEPETRKNEFACSSTCLLYTSDAADE